MPSVQRSDRLLSSGLAADQDEENLLQLHESYPDEPEGNKYSSGSTDVNLSSSDLSLTRTVPGMSDVSKLKSGDSSLSGISMIPQCSSMPPNYGIQSVSEIATAVAGIPSLQSNVCNSSLPSGSLDSSGVQCSHSERIQQEQFSGRSFTSNKSAVVSYHRSTPQQVEDDDEQMNWNPVDDVMHRIRSKIRFLTKSISLSDSDVNLLSMAKGIYFLL